MHHQKLRAARPGMALINAIFLMSILTLTLVAMVSFTQGTMRQTRVVKNDTQAYNVARAGLNEAIAWFKRQEVQPVENFAPVVNLSNALKSDTQDPSQIDPGGGAGKPSLGIVQEFEIDPVRHLWGRFEVGKLTRLTKDAQGKLRNYQIREYITATNTWVDRTVANATNDAYEGVVDIGEDYGFQGKGTVWRIRSHGYVFRRDPTASPTSEFYKYPNEVVSQAQLDTEIFRLQFKDYGSAVVTDKASTTTINHHGPVKGGDGLALLLNIGPLVPPTSTAQLSTDTGGVPYKIINDDPAAPKNVLDWLEVFGVGDPSIIMGLADQKGENYPDFKNSAMKLFYFKPQPGEPLSFYADGTHPAPHTTLVSSGILVVDGDLHIRNWGSNQFSGYIYVNGDCRIDSLFNLNGTMVVRGSLYCNPTNYEYDPAFLAAVRQRLALYRERRSSLRIVSED